MSFEKDGQLCRFFCDLCEETYEVQSHSFKDAYDAAKEHGWRAYKDDELDEWRHKCPNCVRQR